MRGKGRGLSAKSGSFVPSGRTLTPPIVPVTVSISVDVPKLKDELVKLLGDCSDYYINDEPVPNAKTKAVLKIMHTIKSTEGKYPKYSDSCQYYLCPKAFSTYLKGGGELKLDRVPLRSLLYDTLRYDASYWPELSSHVPFSNEELFVDKCANANVLIDLNNLGYVDHRLTRAITNIQRLIRGLPRDESTDVEHHVNLTSFCDVELPPLIDECEEHSFVRWNSQCILEYLTRLTETGDIDKSIFEGVEKHLSNEDIPEPDGVYFTNVLKEKREILYKLHAKTVSDSDMMLKVNILLEQYARGRLHDKRSYYRDVLKFVQLSSQSVADEHRLDNVPLGVTRILLEMLPNYSHRIGKRLMLDFFKLDVAGLSEDEVRRWYFDVVLDDDDVVAANTLVEIKHLRRFVEKGRVRPAVVELCRKKLTEVQKRGIEKKHMYSFAFEVIKVNPVSVNTST